MTSLLPFLESILNDTKLVNSFVLLSVLVLLALLIKKEVAMADLSERSQRLGQILNVAIAPLLIAFVLIVIFKLIEVLR